MFPHLQTSGSLAATVDQDAASSSRMGCPRRVPHLLSRKQSPSHLPPRLRSGRSARLRCPRDRASRAPVSRLRPDAESFPLAVPDPRRAHLQRDERAQRPLFAPIQPALRTRSASLPESFPSSAADVAGPTSLDGSLHRQKPGRSRPLRGPGRPFLDEPQGYRPYRPGATLPCGFQSARVLRRHARTSRRSLSRLRWRRLGEHRCLTPGFQRRRDQRGSLGPQETRLAALEESLALVAGDDRVEQPLLGARVVEVVVDDVVAERCPRHRARLERLDRVP
jgi:hypothetical protein